MSKEALLWWSRIKSAGVHGFNANDYRVMDVLCYQHWGDKTHAMCFTVSELARLCDMDRKSLNRSLAHLMDLGWVRREDFPYGYKRYYSLPKFEEQKRLTPTT